MKSTQAQINQMFVWLVVILVIGAIALIGVRSIGGLIEDKCTIDMVQFKDDLRDTIELGNNFGSRNLKTKSLPCDYYKICFVDARAVEEKSIPIISDEDDDIAEYKRLIEDNVGDGIDNVFLFNGKEVIPVGYVEEVRLYKGDLPSGHEALCIGSPSGRVEFIQEGLGKNTLLQAK